MAVADTPRPDGQAGGPQLRVGALSLWHLVVLGIAYMGLALTAYFNFGIMEGITGPVVPLVFLAVTVAMLPTAISFAVMNSRRPSAGSALTWMWEATRPPVGVWLGWILVCAYVAGSLLQPIMFGLFFNSLLDVFGIGTSFWTGAIAGLCGVGVIALLTKQNIQVSAKLTAYLIAIEAGFVTLLCAIIIVKQGLDGDLSFQPLNPAAATAGAGGFRLALLFAVLAIAAFDIVAPMAEETKTPRNLVPRATIYVTIGAGLFWVFTSFGIINATSPETMAKYVESNFTAVYLIADDYIGPFKFLVPITGMTAVFAAFSAISVAASRLLFSLSREQLAPRWFSEVDEHQTPWNAQKFVLASCTVVPILLAVWQSRSQINAFSWLGQAIVFFVLIPYTMVCVANIAYHRRFHRHDLNVWLNVVLPVVGIAINLYIAYENFVKTLLIDAEDFKTQSSIVAACVAVAALMAVFTWRSFSRRKGAGGSRTDLHRLDESPIAPVSGGVPV